MFLNKNLQEIKGINMNKYKKLNKLGIYSVRDLLYYFPRQYEDKSKIKKIKNLVNEEKVAVCGKIIFIDSYSKDKLKVLKIKIKDDTGSCQIVFFNQMYLEKQFNVGDNVVAFGKVKKDCYKTEIVNCEIEKNATKSEIGKITSVYALCKGVNNKDVKSSIKSVIENDKFKINEYIPDYILEKYKLCGIDFAIKNIHKPDNINNLKIAMYRLVFEEFLMLQVGLLYLKDENTYEKSISIKNTHEIKNVINTLPFKLTNAQDKVLCEILNDMKEDRPMNRLVQGDVGSGKTIVAALALIGVVFDGYQGCMMAPTEILAHQHYESFKSLFKDFKIGLLVGSQTKKQKKIILDELKDGKIDILIGTHALIEESVIFKNLALVVTDEQHRFGVKQRARLFDKGNNPHILVMTATPIPRTLALILHADLDVSIIDELPPGRQKIQTLSFEEKNRKRVYEFAKKEIKKSRQVYIVAPLVEESDSIDAKSVLTLIDELKDDYLKDVNLDILHGKMKAKEKDDIMNRFKSNEISALISTTVIEVGVNVPNATLMIVENAERFGLSQLHQLRGRVGRGEFKSYCILIHSSNNDVTKKRMEIMTSTNDGFEISQRDLQIRGPGEFFGTKQHGLPELKIANIFKHMKILKDVQILSKNIMKEDKTLKKYPLLKREIENKFQKNLNDIYLN